MANRVLPAAAIKLYDAGAEGWHLENGFDLYDLPTPQLAPVEDQAGQALQAWTYTPSFRTLSGSFVEPSVEGYREISVVAPRPRVIYRDTPAANYTLSGAQWEEVLTLAPDPGGARHLRLTQYETAANQVFRAESKYNLPVNANLAFTVQRLSPPHDHDETVNLATVDVILSGAWMVRFSESDTAGIWHWTRGQWQQAKHFNLAAREETLILAMVRRGCVGFSFDGGHRWEWFRGAAPLSIPSGAFTVEVVACQAAFGFHELAFDSCWFESYPLPVLEDHLGVPLLDLSQTLRPAGTGLRVTERPSPPATLRYRCTFTPASFNVLNLGHPFWSVPEVWGLGVYWPPVLAAPVGGYVDLATVSTLTSVEITEDTELTGRSGSLVLHWEPSQAFTGSYGNRLVDVDLGYALDDGTYDLHDRAVMYLILPEPGAEPGNGEIRFELIDLWFRAEVTIVDEGWRPLDGMTAIAARNYVLLKMGVDYTTRAAWLNTGAVLPSGLPDQPRWWPHPGQTAAELLRALDVFENTESFVAADGTWTSRRVRYVDPTVSFVFDGDARTSGTSPDYSILRLRNRAEHRQQRTATLVKGQDTRAGGLWATSIDYARERNPATAGFTGYRRWQRLENEPVVTLAQALLIAAQRQVLAGTVPQLPELDVPGAPALYRGQRIQLLHATNTGIVAGNEWRVESLVHRWVSGKKSETITSIKARQMV